MRTAKDPAEITRRLWEEYQIIGGLPVARLEKDRPDWWLLTATEMNTREQIDRLVAGVRAVMESAP